MMMIYLNCCYFCNCIQVLVCLKENCRDVPLRVVSKEAGLTIEDLFESLTEEEIKKIDDICMDIDKEMEQVSGTLSLSSSVINTSDFSEKAPNYYSDETLLQLMVTLHRSYNSVSSLGWDYDGVDEQKVVNVGGYKISKKLAPILEKLLSKYGDLADYALSLSSGLKNDFVIRLCEVVQSMYMTVIMEISSELIFNWWYQLRIVQPEGLELILPLII